jgi:G3E family GTPase
VGIDHHLVRKTDVRTTLLRNGCICCSMRDDLSEALRHLLSQRERGTIPHFGRVVIETTGLADPAPILHTIVAEPVVRNHFRTERVGTTIDAVNGASNLDNYGEALRQVAAADHVIVTKLDLATPEVTEELKAKLRSINPAASVVEASFGNIDFRPLLAAGSHGAVDGMDRLNGVSFTLDRDPIAPTAVHAMSDRVTSRCLVFDRSLNWQMFGIWLTMLLHRQAIASCG